MASDKQQPVDDLVRELSRLKAENERLRDEQAQHIEQMEDVVKLALAERAGGVRFVGNIPGSSSASGFAPLTTEPAAPFASHRRETSAVVSHEAAAWQSQDLIESVSYVSQNFGLVRYEGIDRYFGQSTHKFSTGHGARYVLPEALNDFLAPKPVTRPAEQAVTEAMVDAAANQLGFGPADSVRIRAALKAAMEAGR